MKLDRRGRLRWFALCYDPLEATLYRLRDDVSAYASLCITQFVLPQDPELGTLLYEASVRTLGWDDPAKPLLQLHPDPRFAGYALLLARELGDTVTESRLRELAERDFEPRFFSLDSDGAPVVGTDRFGWFLGNGEPWPRGQDSALLLQSELGAPGAWSAPFRRPNLVKLAEPTLSGVAYPDLGVAQAWNDRASGCLWVETYAATTAARGRPTTWRVDLLPDPASVVVACDGRAHAAWRVVGEDAIEVDSDIGEHTFRLETGYHGQPTTAGRAMAVTGVVKAGYTPGVPAGGSCCPG